MVYDPSLALVWPNTIWSPTFRSLSAMVWPPLVIVVELPTVIVRVQPSSVLSDRLEPLIAVIEISPKRPNLKPGPPRMSSPAPRIPILGPMPSNGAAGLAGVVVPESGLAAGADDGEGEAPIAA